MIGNLKSNLPPKYLSSAEVEKELAIYRVQNTSPIARLEKLFGCKVTGVISATPASKQKGLALSAGQFYVQLSAVQRSGVESSISTSLDATVLKSLGWNTPVAKTVPSTPQIPEDNGNFNQRWLYASLNALKSRLIYSGIDADFVKAHYQRRFGVAHFAKFPERELALAAAELNAMRQSEAVYANRVAQMKEPVRSKA